jgi:L-ascorbate metabolism protein UlaG (beta-lactamase superfamily)
MKKIILLLSITTVVVIIAYLYTRNNETITVKEPPNNNEPSMTNNKPVKVTPVSHASMVLTWGDTTIYNDPTGGAELYSTHDAPDIVLVSDIHGDHLNAETLENIITNDTIFIAPQAVIDLLPEGLAVRATLLTNNSETTVEGIKITALPMYNLPEQGVEIRHEKGRGNGYLLEKDGYRVYIAGDTADIPEMRSLSDIDMAFIPMNLPFTMSVETAASAVADFAPESVYPYHYRGRDGLSDTRLFKTLVNDANKMIEVVLLNWYPES